MTKEDALGRALEIARTVSAEGHASVYAVIMTDEGTAMLVRRDIVREVIATIVREGGGLHAGDLDAFTRQITDLPRWKVPIVLWHGNRLSAGVYTPGHVQ